MCESMNVRILVYNTFCWIMHAITDTSAVYCIYSEPELNFETFLFV